MIDTLRKVKKALREKNAVRKGCEMQIAAAREQCKVAVDAHTNMMTTATRKYSRQLKAALPINTEISFMNGGTLKRGFVVDYGSKNNICVQTIEGVEIWVTVSQMMNALDEMEKTQ